MSTNVYLYAEERGLNFRVEPETNGRTVWIRTNDHNVVISLTMDKSHRDALRKVLDAADADEAANLMEVPE